MNILFIGNWSASDGLSEATIRPHLELLSKYDYVERIVFSSYERNNNNIDIEWNIKKLVFQPFFGSNLPGPLNYLSDLYRRRKLLFDLHKDFKFNLVICRSSPAGIYGYLLHKKLNVPFVVESFEPHSSYMLEAGVWNIWSLKYWIQLIFEKKQIRSALKLITVSEGYQHALQKKFRPNRFAVGPCAVSLEKFKFSYSDREELRRLLQINNSQVVFIYSGKIGDMYYFTEAFNLFVKLRKEINGIHFLILSRDDDDILRNTFNSYGVSDEEFTLTFVKPDEVPRYLSAADYGICLHKSSKSSYAYSPIKNGEYWANGLPILIDENIGDDSSLVKEKNLGIVVNMKKMPLEIDKDKIITLIEDTSATREDNRMVQAAKFHRTIKHTESIYEDLINEIQRANPS